MKLDSKYFDRIRINRDKDHAAKAAARDCEWPGCSMPGSYRAPKGRGREGQYFHYCLEHVREYNKHYNYFSGMSDEEVAAFQAASMTGHRPTWNVGLGPRMYARATSSGNWRGYAYAFGMSDPYELFGTGAGNAECRNGWPHGRPLHNAERKSLRTLGLDEGATASQIRAQFKTLVLRHHPDQNGGDRSSEDKLREVIQAYQYLRKAGLC